MRRLRKFFGFDFVCLNLGEIADIYKLVSKFKRRKYLNQRAGRKCPHWYFDQVRGK